MFLDPFRSKIADRLIIIKKCMYMIMILLETKHSIFKSNNRIESRQRIPPFV